VIDAPLALAFSQGLLAAVNPCGLPMLPAYLTYFLGVDADHERDGGTDQPAVAGSPVVRAVVVGATVSLAFCAVFGVAGALLSWFSVGVYDVSPWLTVVIGGALLALGGALLAGWEPRAVLPKLERGADGRTLRSMFLFGVSYAVASLSCTLPLFLSTISTTFERETVASGVAVFGAYTAGMALVLMALTMSIALARGSLVRLVRGALPYVQRVAGALVAITGAYILYYGIYEIRLGTPTGGGSVIDRVSGWSADISTWVHDVGAERIGIVLAAFVACGVVLGLARSRTTGDQGASRSSSQPPVARR
jgi:cytochrome c-type biogenesis protein